MANYWRMWNDIVLKNFKAGFVAIFSKSIKDPYQVVHAPLYGFLGWVFFKLMFWLAPILGNLCILVSSILFSFALVGIFLKKASEVRSFLISKISSRSY